MPWTLRHVWSMWGASFIAGWLGWKGLCASFRATVVFSCGLLVKCDWLLGSSGQKPAGDHYYCWKNIAPCHRMVAPAYKHWAWTYTCKHVCTVEAQYPYFYFHILCLKQTTSVWNNNNTHTHSSQKTWRVTRHCRRGICSRLSQVEKSAVSLWIWV